MPIKTLIILLFCCTFFVAANPHKDNALITQRAKFKQFDLKSFYFGGEQSNFVWLNMPAFFHHVAIPAETPRPLPQNIRAEVANSRVALNGELIGFDEYVIQDKRIDSIVILHKGTIVYARYNSHSPYDRHIAWSVTKVIVSAALARLAHQKRVDVNASVETYLPDFGGTDWGSISVQDVADMASGMNCLDSDGFEEPQNCVYQVDEIFGLMPKVADKLPTVMDFLKTIKASKTVSKKTEYNSANTLILGFIIEAVTGQPLHAALATLIWKPMGAESDGLMLVNKFGEAYAGGGISARLADIARFGLLFLPGLQDRSLLNVTSSKHSQEGDSSTFSKQQKAHFARLFKGDLPVTSKWQWDLIWQNGDMYKDGFSGQGIYVSPSKELVFAWFGTADKQFKKHHLLPIAHQLARSSVFN